MAGRRVSRVLALESLRPRGSWAGLRGSRDTDLDREQAERQAAEYAVARADADLLAAHEETRRTGARPAELGDVQGRRERALDAKEEWLLSTGGEAGIALGTEAEQLAATRPELTEVREALPPASSRPSGCTAPGRPSERPATGRRTTRSPAAAC
ncbi:hypothetical protein [Nocardioides sp. LHG3406-4]|uniref:hypothetical protein n=1 Tax=Nocardioides sp. LHG3406-4 TaxID=2804575 RepID=UPI003CFAF6AF